MFALNVKNLCKSPSPFTLDMPNVLRGMIAQYLTISGQDDLETVLALDATGNSLLQMLRTETRRNITPQELGQYIAIINKPEGFDKYYWALRSKLYHVAVAQVPEIIKAMEIDLRTKEYKYPFGDSNHTDIEANARTLSILFDMALDHRDFANARLLTTYYVTDDISSLGLLWWINNGDREQLSALLPYTADMHHYENMEMLLEAAKDNGHDDMLNQLLKDVSDHSHEQEEIPIQLKYIKQAPRSFVTNFQRAAIDQDEQFFDYLTELKDHEQLPVAATDAVIAHLKNQYQLLGFNINDSVVTMCQVLDKRASQVADHDNRSTDDQIAVDASIVCEALQQFL